MTVICKIPGRFVETEVDGEVVVMDTSSGRFYALEATGLAIWRAIDGKTGRDSLVADLAERFGECVDIVGADVDAFLATLRDAGLVEERAAA